MPENSGLTPALRTLADLWQVPVSAGVRLQYDSGSLSYTYRFEGPVVTAYPGGLSLQDWAKRQAHQGKMKMMSAHP